MKFLEFCEVLGVALTEAQTVLCAVAFDGAEPRDLQGAQREIARQLFGDVDTIPALARMVLVTVAGARSGKTYIGALRLLHLAITAPLDVLAPGEIASACIVAPDVKTGRQALRYALGAVQSSPALAGMLEAQTADSFVIRRADGHRVTVEVLAATRGGSAVRGRSFVAALLDEFAFFRDESSVVNDAAIFEAIAVRVIAGGQLLILSTAWTEAGLLYKFFTEQHGKPRDAMVAHAPTVLMRPSQAERVAAAYEADHLLASREFGAEFLTAGAGSYFDAVAINAAVDKSRTTPLPPAPEQRAFAAADFAFNSDHSALVIVRIIGGKATLVDWLEVKPKRGQPLKPSEVVALFAAVMKRHGVAGLTADGHYKESVREHLEAHGLRFWAADGGNGAKLTAYSRSQSLFREQRAALPNLPRLIGQLKDVNVRPLPGGTLQISHPRRAGKGHGDLSAALVLALAAAWHDVRRIGRKRDRGAAVGKRDMVQQLERAEAVGLDNLEIRGTSVVIAPPRPRSQLTMRGGRGGF